MTRNPKPPDTPLAYDAAYGQPASPPVELPAVFTAAELMAMHFPEPRYAVEGIVAAGLNLLVGSPKVGKSWLALGLGIAVASGGRAFGSIPVEAGDVAYLALEDSPRRLHKRVGMILNGEPAPDRLRIATTSQPMPEGADMLDRWLEATPEARLVVVDVLAKVRPRTNDQNRYDADYAVLAPLHELAHKHDVAVMVVHHTRKARSDDFVDSVSGTAGLAGAADAVLALTRQRNAPGAVLSVTGRDIEECERALDFDPITGTWRILEGPASDYRLSSQRREILKVLRASGDTALGPKALASATGVSDKVVQQLVGKMVEAGDIERVGRGQYRCIHNVHNVHNGAENPALPMDPGAVSL